MVLVREVDAIKATGLLPAGIDRRVARLEMLMLPGVSDGTAELSASTQAALDDALLGVTRGEA
jgi:hypothetical protein